MKELKCPKCGNVFQVDEADYASIVSQVKNAEFNDEVDRRIDELHKRYETEKQLDAAKAEQQYQQELNKKDAEISRLRGELDAEIDQRDNKLKLAVMEAESKVKEEMQAIKDKAKDDMREKDDRIRDLEKQAILDAQKAVDRERGLQEQHKRELDMKDEVIAQYRDFKRSLSTKMIGESLEVYCSNQYEMMVRPYMQEAEFGKDNEVSDHTKGDFVFRDIVDGLESVSIMFEMKNEADDTVNKHKNSEFFDKLDRDRKKKNCEYAVLVTMLELDNDLYNNGIYAVPSHEKMFVVRPQQFLTIISILVQTGRNTVKVKRELENARNREVDVTNFEAKVEKVKKVFGVHIKDAANRYNDALANIDKAIEELTNMKNNLRLWVDHLYDADGNLDDLTVRKLTYKNPTMKAKFDEARQIAAQAEEVTDGETV